MLRVENLSIRRGGKTVLEGLELELRPGEMLGVLGPNGAGKSTLLGALCGELEPAEGLVLLDERGLDDWPGVARAQRLAVLPQSSSLGFAFPVEAVVGFGRLPHSSGRERDVQIVAEALAAADASHLAGRSYLCDRLLLLQNGRPHLLGTPEEVLRPEPLRAVFGLEVLVQRHPERGHPLIVAR